MRQVAIGGALLLAVAGVSLTLGCEREIARESEVEVRPDGTRIEEEKRVIDEENGVRIEEEKTIDRP